MDGLCKQFFEGRAYVGVLTKKKKTFKKTLFPFPPKNSPSSPPKTPLEQTFSSRFFSLGFCVPQVGCAASTRDGERTNLLSHHTSLIGFSAPVLELRAQLGWLRICLLCMKYRTSLQNLLAPWLLRGGRSGQVACVRMHARSKKPRFESARGNGRKNNRRRAQTRHAVCI